MPDKPQDKKPVPTFEEVQDELGPELMGFLSEMLSEPADTEKG